MKFQGFIGPAYKLDSVNVAAQRCVNLYVEPIESGIGKEGQLAYLTTTPGLELLCEVGDGPIRCVHTDYLGRVWVASGDKLFTLQVVGGEIVPVNLGTSFGGDPETPAFDTSEGIIKAASNGADGSTFFDGSVSSTMFVDGTKMKAFWDEGNASASYGDVTDPPLRDGVDTADEVVWVDGFFVVNEKGTNKFWSSNLGGFNFDGLDFASAEGSPDKIVSVIDNHRDLWFLNEKSCEVFINTGNADFPFERVQGGYLEIGITAKYSAAKINGTILWLGNSEKGQGIVYAAKGMQPQPVSTHAIERTIAKYNNIQNATAYTYEMNGHQFYVLNFDEATWVYNLTTGMWHEWLYTNEGLLERHRGNLHAFHPGRYFDNGSPVAPLKINYPLHIVADYETNKLYALKDDVYTDNGNAITRLRVAPHLSAGGKTVFCSEFFLDMETGVGLDGDVQGSDPQVMLSWSNDGGHTWSDEWWASAGKKIGGIGEFTKRVIWRRLGRFRSRVFAVKCTDPVKIRIIDAQIEVEGGNS